MMQMATLEKELPQLTESKSDVCLSLYMPFQQEPDKSEENRIRIKNLTKEAVSLLKPYGVEGDLENESAMQEAIRIMLESDTTPRRGRGLAIFMTADQGEIHFARQPFDQKVVVDRRFYVKPLLSALSSDNEFYLLALSQGEVRLYQADGRSMDDITPDDLPENLDDAMSYEDPEKRQQYHTSTDSPMSPGEQPAAYHTHHPEAEKKSFIRRYFQQIADVLSNQLDDTRPILLAGVDYLLPIYREASSSDQLLDDVVSGNPFKITEHELHKLAWQVARNHFAEQRETAVSQYRNLISTDQTSDSLTEVVAAAQFGRVDTLFASLAHDQWGTFDEETGAVTAVEPSPESQELTNFAVYNTLKNNGRVLVLPNEEMPVDAPLVAIFRY